MFNFFLLKYNQMNRKWEKQNTWQINEKKKIEKNSLNEWEKNHISMKMMKIKGKFAKPETKNTFFICEKTWLCTYTYIIV